MEKSSTGTHSVGYEYDSINNLTKLVETIGTVERKTSYTYDEDNRPKTGDGCPARQVITRRGMCMISLDLRTITKNEPIAIYCNKERTDRFFVGHLMAYHEDCLLVNLWDTRAKDDGIGYFSTSAIFRIEYRTQYLRNLKQYLHSAHKQSSYCDSWKQFWEYAEKKALIVQTKRRNCKRALFGVPITHDITTVVLKRVLCNGEITQEIKVNRADIACAICESATELRIQRKYERNTQDD